MSARGPGRNAGRNRGRVGPDGLRERERDLLGAARAGEPLAPELAVMLLERIAKMRYGHAQAHAEQIASHPGAALAEAYDELSSAFVLLITEQAVLEAHVTRLRVAAERRARTDAQMESEMRRLREERDEARQAARDADGRRLALYRVLELAR